MALLGHLSIEVYFCVVTVVYELKLYGQLGGMP